MGDVVGNSEGHGTLYVKIDCEDLRSRFQVFGTEDIIFHVDQKEHIPL